ncbi:MAG TPA: hypothetical protein VGQ29_00710 [Gemmatimonadales bacterium]|nr:hypothetical protein [Gemmatimonadales bacterium]
MFARPEFQWVEQRRLLSWLARQWQRLVDWLNLQSAEHPIAFNIVVALIVVALVVVLVHIGYVVWRIVRPAMRTGPTKAVVGTGAVLDAAAHLRMADELASAGRYAEALGHRFLAVVLELDRRKALRFHASKTPAEYVWEARLTDQGRASLADLVAQLYRHLFAAVPCDADEYESFGAAAQELVRGQYVVPA